MTRKASRTLATVTILTLTLLFASIASADSGRRRAARHPATACSSSLAAMYAVPVPADGFARGVIAVSSTCASWNAFSDVAWITVEADPRAAQPAAYLNVLPNASTEPRSATIWIAGIAHNVTQLGKPALADGNVLKNPTFNFDLSNWGWDARDDKGSPYPNGEGFAVWSSADANGSIASGSILLRSTKSGHSFQQLQCVPIQAGKVYLYGGALKAGSASEGRSVIGLYEFAGDGCTQVVLNQTVKAHDIAAREPGVWERQSFSFRAGNTRSLLFVIGTRTLTAAPFETNFDDLFIRLK